MEKKTGKHRNAVFFIQLVMTSLWGIKVGIPVISIKFLKLENNILRNLSELGDDVTLGCNQNKEVTSSRGGHS